MKKFAGLFISVLFWTAAVFGQTDSGLQIVRHEWKPDPLTDGNRPGAVNVKPNEEYETARKDNPTAPLVRNRDGSHSINPDSSRVNPIDDPDVPTVVRRPQKMLRTLLEVRNDSPRTVVEIEFDYVLYDRDKKEYLRYRVMSDKEIKPGKTLRVKKTESAADLARKMPVARVFALVPAATKVEIVRVKYDDDSVWTAK